MKRVEQIGDQINFQLLHALAILVHVANCAHRTGRVELELLEVLVDHSMKAYAQFRENALHVLPVHAVSDMSNLIYHKLHDHQTSRCIEGVNNVSLRLKVRFSLFTLQKHLHPTDNGVYTSVEAHVQLHLDLLQSLLLLRQAIRLFGR